MSATIKPFTDEFEEYGRDESRASGEASSISFPTTEDEVRAILETLHAERVPVTVQGARTGLAAGAVPHGGHILNTSRMNRYLGLRRDEQSQFLLRVEPGVVLSELRKQLSKKVLPTAGWDPRAVRSHRSHRGICLSGWHGGMQRLRRPQLRLRPHAPAYHGTPRRAG